MYFTADVVALSASLDGSVECLRILSDTFWVLWISMISLSELKILWFCVVKGSRLIAWELFSIVMYFCQPFQMLFDRPIDEVVDHVFILEGIVLIKVLVCFEGRDISFFQFVHTLFFEAKVKGCLPFLQFLLMHGFDTHEFIYNCRLYL